jgi:hypothetical protein
MQLLLDTLDMAETTTTRRPGRPAKDNSAEIGMRYGKLVILALLPSIDHGGQRVLAACDCSGVTETRLNRLQTGKTTSCGCVKVLRFQEFLVRQVAKMPANIVVACWEDHFNGQDRKDIAAARDLQVAIVDEAIRTHQRYLDTLLVSGTAGQIYLESGEKGGLTAAAAAHSLPLISSRYLVMAISRKPVAARPYMTDLDWWAVGCEDLTDRVADRTQNYNLGFKQTGEFTFKEIRRSKGKILGMLAPDYLAARQLLSGRLEIDQVRRLTPFINLVNATFASRQRRQRAGAIRFMKDKRKSEAFDRHQMEISRQLNSELCQERMAA